MQVFATRKTPALGGVLLQLTSLTKSPMTVRIMKLTAILLLGACLQLSARGISQTITLALKDVPLQKVFKEIERQTDFTFFIEAEALKNAKTVTILAKNLPLNQVLDLCFKDQPFTYSFSGKTIAITFKKEKSDHNKSSVDQKPINIKGRIVNANGEPISDATISIEGTTKRTSTNANGEFTLNDVDENAAIIISHIQYETTRISLEGKSFLNASLRLKINDLDELQVIAYGTTTKRFNTGNISSVKASDIEKQPVSNPLLALEGRVPGLFITQNTGVPGGGITVRLQGINSLRSGNDPLYIIDGVPYFSQIPATGFDNVLGNSGGLTVNGSTPTGNPLNYINPADIESIDVLKDADATAIYGSRAANGAILITTKKGKAGKSKFDINLQHGWGAVTRKFDVMNTQQYLSMRYEAFQNDGIDWTDPSAYADDLKVWDTTHYTNWQKELIGGTAKLINVSSNVSGGTSNFQYLIGGTFRRETTVFPGDFSDQKASINFKINTTSLNQRLSFQLSGNYMVDNNKLPNKDLTENAIILVPNAPNLYNSDGTLNWMPDPSGTSTWNNPVRYIYQPYEIKSNNLISNAVINYKLIDGLIIRSSFGYTNLQLNDFTSTPMIVVRPEDRTSNNARNASYGNRNLYSWIIEPQANYTRAFGKSKVDVLIGSTIQQNNTTGSYIGGTGYTNDASLRDVKSAATIRAFNSLDFVYKYNAIFGRINYNLKSKYIVNLTARRDGSSRFGSKNQFQNFGSVGAAWIFTNESIFAKAVNFLSYGKLRGSYGTTGNDQIGDYQYMNLYRPATSGIPYQNITIIRPTALPNPYIQWEETKKLQLGIDLGFINDRVLLSATYVKNRSSNQLLNYVLPPFVGFESILENFPATIQNTALEMSLSGFIIKTNRVKWEGSLNITIPKNKVTKFPDIERSNYASGDNGVIVGQPLGVLKVYPYIGVDPATGTYQFLTNEGDITNTPDYANDRTELISTLPKFYGGFQNSLSYKEFQLDILFQFVKQIGTNYFFYNPRGAFPGEFFGEYSNQPVTVLDRWQKSGDVVGIHKYSTMSDDNMYNAAASNYPFSDASYIRLKNIQISYSLSNQLRRKLQMHNVRIYLQGQNLFTVTKYKGMDPENQSISSLPPLRMLTVGLQIAL